MFHRILLQLVVPSRSSEDERTHCTGVEEEELGHCEESIDFPDRDDRLGQHKIFSIKKVKHSSLDSDFNFCFTIERKILVY